MSKSAQSKREIATAIYNRHKNPTRAVVLPKIMEKCDLSESGASTYYQHLKLGRWT